MFHYNVETMDSQKRRQVGEFYNQDGWIKIGEDYQNCINIQDLREVSREYKSRCRTRVMRYLKPTGKFLLDAGSGPIPFPEFLEYSRGYKRRVCADISITALKDARNRIGDHGLFVIAEITALPFKADEFDGMVAMNVPHF